MKLDPTVYVAINWWNYFPKLHLAKREGNYHNYASLCPYIWSYFLP